MTNCYVDCIGKMCGIRFLSLKVLIDLGDIFIDRVYRNWQSYKKGMNDN